MGRFDRETTKPKEPISHRFFRAKEYYGDEGLSSEEELHHVDRYIKTGEKIRPNKPSEEQWEKTVPAKYGFHGYVNHPVKFLAGEHGRERIDIHRIKKKKHNNQNMYSMDMSDVSKYLGGRW